MTEITIKIPQDIKNIIDNIDDHIYLEAIKEISRRKISEKRKELKLLLRKVKRYELKYSSNYETFCKNIPDKKTAHDDWIEWSYLSNVVKEKQQTIEKLEKLLGK